MGKTIQYLKEIVEANKGKKEIFYLAHALDTNGNSTDTRTKIKTINKTLQADKVNFYLKYYDFIKVKIVISN